jgi:hypothetical protein
MTAAAADRAIDPLALAAAHPSTASGPGILKINPATGLSTDYLNHFTEAVMVLEMASTMPECLDDLRAWRPKNYREYFECSRFSDRLTVIRAYEAADPAVREALDAVAETLNAVLVQIRTAVLGHLGAPVLGDLIQRAVSWLKPLIARAGGVINGAAFAPSPRSGKQAPQASIDAIFGR